MSELKLFVESIVTDLIEARFEADLKAAELAEVYRDHPALRQLNVPTLNISNVTVDLRVAFDDSAIGEADGPSEAQERAITEAAVKLRTEVAALDSVKKTVKVPRQRAAFTNSVNAAVIRSAKSNVSSTPANRSKAVEAELRGVLSKNRVRLSAADRKTLQARLREFDATVSAAPKAASVSMLST